jgi:hypothetical protein
VCSGSNPNARCPATPTEANRREESADADSTPVEVYPSQLVGDVLLISALGAIHWPLESRTFA